ncbi:MAG: lytic transglycosylase F [Candidatus Rokuibacteriota bacterium]|nr:MAG: lytic transglycosylase F [Candidatus Rokubacteria bacterium]
MRLPVLVLRRVRTVALLSSLVVIATGAAAQTPAQTPAQAPAKQPPAKQGLPPIGVTGKTWTGDFDGMVKRRVIRALVPYSKTFYFVDRAIQRGLSYDITRLLEADINKKLKTGNIRIHVLCIPVTRGEMIPALLEGRGDIAMGNLTITPERQKQVDFTHPTARNVVEILVTGPGAEPVATVEDLSGKEVYLRKSSSYYQSIETLNAELAKTKKAPVKVRQAPENLEDEDVLEMVNAGLVKMTVVEDYLANFWKQIFTKLTPHPDVKVRTGGEIAWMIRKDSPKLKEELDAFLARFEKSGQRTDILARYLKNTRWAKGATSPEDLKRFEEAITLFRKYGERYDWDYLLLMAQGYQESELRQSARSPVGAIGVMQVMPATGKDMRVGDIDEIEPNIHAGVKFLRAMMNEYYAKEPMDRLNKGLFTFAAYNAGPGRVRGLRRTAAERGLNPNVWFNNVELIAAEKIGRETVTYVSNIYKYYLAYQMIEEERAEREKTKQELKGGTRK